MTDAEQRKVSAEERAANVVKEHSQWNAGHVGRRDLQTIIASAIRLAEDAAWNEALEAVAAKIDMMDTEQAWVVKEIVNPLKRPEVHRDK